MQRLTLTDDEAQAVLDALHLRMDEDVQTVHDNVASAVHDSLFGDGGMDEALADEATDDVYAFSRSAARLARLIRKVGGAR